MLDDGVTATPEAAPAAEAVDESEPEVDPAEIPWLDEVAAKWDAWMTATPDQASLYFSKLCLEVRPLVNRDVDPATFARAMDNLQAIGARHNIQPAAIQSFMQMADLEVASAETQLNESMSEIVEEWERNDPRDSWKHTGEPPPAEPDSYGASEREEEAPYLSASSQPSQTIKTVSFLTLLEEEVAEEPDYIEPDFAGPGQFILIAGPPKAQKSLLLQEILYPAPPVRRFCSGLSRWRGRCASSGFRPR